MMGENEEDKKKEMVFSGHQPNFLPYMGFFYKMYKSDVFVLDDDVQFTRSGMHNYNFIKVNNERHKITVPVRYRFGDLIKDVKICYEQGWRRKMEKTIRVNYSRAPFFEEVMPMIEKHLGMGYEYLIQLNIGFITEIAEKLGIRCKMLVASNDVPTDLSKNARNIYQCVALGGNVYYSGIGGRAYNDDAEYAKNGIKVVYSNYAAVEYKQAGREFIKDLSVMDYIFNCGYRIPKEWEG